MFETIRRAWPCSCRAHDRVLRAGGRVAGLAEQQPHGGHCRCAGADLERKFRFGPCVSVAKLAQFAVGNPVDGRVVRGLVQCDLNQFGLDAQPGHKPLAPLGRIIAKQAGLRRTSGWSGRVLVGPKSPSLGRTPPKLRHQGFASGRGPGRRPSREDRCGRSIATPRAFRLAIGRKLSQSGNSDSRRSVVSPHIREFPIKLAPRPKRCSLGFAAWDFIRAATALPGHQDISA